MALGAKCVLGACGPAVGSEGAQGRRWSQWVGTGSGIGEPGEEAFRSREGGDHREAAGVRVAGRQWDWL